MPFIPEDTPTIPIDVVYLRETDRAVLVETEDGEEVWLPLSQIGEFGEPEPEQLVRIDVPEWLALKSGLI